MSAHLYIKRVYDPPAASDGQRILVDRLWPRGVRKEVAALDLWCKDIAPSPELRKWFGHQPERFAVFRDRYRAELAGNEGAVRHLKDLLANGDVTLLYAAHDPACNHARVLAEFLEEH